MMERRGQHLILHNLGKDLHFLPNVSLLASLVVHVQDCLGNLHDIVSSQRTHLTRKEI